MKATDAGEEADAGQAGSVSFVAVAALCCCTLAGSLTLLRQPETSRYGC
jgi:hypothetical protein